MPDREQEGLDVTRSTVEGLLRRLPESAEEEADAILTELVRRFEPVVRKGWMRTPRHTEYHDFANEVFKRVLGALPTLREPRTFPLFFKNCVRSVAGDLMRQAMKPTESLEDFGEVLETVDAEITVPLVVRSYLEYLGEKEREVLEMEYIAGYTTEEIARRIGMTPGGVRVTKSRALRRLHEVVERDRKTLERLAQS